MFQISRLHFFSGPNLYVPMPGILVDLSYPTDLNDHSQTPLQYDKDYILELLFRNFKVCQEYGDFKDIRINKDPLDLCKIIYLICDALMADFNVFQKRQFKNIGTPNKGNLNFFIVSDHFNIGTRALELSIDFVNHLLTSESFNEEQMAEKYIKFRITSRMWGLNQTNIAIARGALNRKIPFYRINIPGQILQLGQGVNHQRVCESVTDKTSSISRIITGDKLLTNNFLEKLNIPTPKTTNINDFKQCLTFVEKNGFPIVIKPRSSGKGQGVTTNIRSNNELVAAVKGASKYNKGLVIEKHLNGDDYRILLVNNQVVAAAKRTAASVVGDGTHTINELIAIENKKAIRGMPFEKLLEEITIDLDLEAFIAKQNLSLSSIPLVDERIILRGAANISQGGTSVDVTDVMHSDNKKVFELATKVTGLDIAGIDFISEDISVPWHKNSAAIIEINSSPGLRPHLSANQNRNIIDPMLDWLFENKNGRFLTVGLITKDANKDQIETCLIELASSNSVSDFHIVRNDKENHHHTIPNLFDKNARHLIVCFSEQDVMLTGLPLDYFDLTIEIDDVDKNYRSLLDQHSSTYASFNLLRSQIKSNFNPKKLKINNPLNFSVNVKGNLTFRYNQTIIADNLSADEMTGISNENLLKLLLPAVMKDLAKSVE